MKPLFTIIVPTYNRGQLLKISLLSVIRQDFENWECIIVDDGSTDNTKEIISACLKDPRIKYFYKENEERSIARNFGIGKALGKYICFLDSDDIYYPNHLQVLYNCLESRTFPVAVINSGMNENRNGNLVPRPSYSELEFDHPVYFIWEKFMLPTSVCVHREVVKDDLFPSNFNVWEDTHLWLRLLIRYPFIQIEEITTQWNVHKESSVEVAFSDIKTVHVKKYFDCINDLFNRYSTLLQPYLTNEDKRHYQLKKLERFLGICFERRQYSTFISLYSLGLKTVSFKQLNRFTLNLLKRKIKGKIPEYLIKLH